MKSLRLRWCLGLIFSAGLSLNLLTLHAAQSLSLESVMSSAFPTNLVASPRGDTVAWIFYEQGRRNIWVARGPEYKARPLTTFDADDGQEISDLAFSADGSSIFFVRGADSNRSGENPNPTSDPAGAEQAVWIVPAAGGAPRRLGEGNNPTPSPADQRVVFLSKGKIFLAQSDGDSKPELLFRARGTCGQPVWSPAGAQLAFVSSRQDHSFVGLYEFAPKNIRWICPSVDRDTAPAFSPDGRRLAFLRFPGAMSSPSLSEGQSFGIQVVEIASGQAREVWRSPDASGGFAQYYPSAPLQWAAGGRLLFYSEHEGWMRLYSLSTAGGPPVGLSPAEAEVEDCALSPDGTTLAFNGNATDIDRRHLWLVRADGGAPQLLTPGRGIEWAPAWLAGGEIAFLCSTAVQPAAPAILRIADKTRRLLAPEAIPASFPGNKLVEPAPVLFKAGDGLEIHGQLFLPSGAKPGDRRPALIFMHGGPMRQMLLGWHMRGYYHNAYAFNQHMAGLGFAVLSVNYRSGIGYGRAFRIAANRGFRGAAEYQDIVAAAKYLQTRPEVNSQKIGLWGGSYGGYLTALGLARDSEIFAAGVDLHGVHDWTVDSRGEARWAGWPEEIRRSAFDSSPVADIRFWSSPVLMIHGDDDRNVDFLQTVDLVQRLRREGRVHVETLVFPDEVHGFLLHRNWLEAYRAAADFFVRFLKGQPSMGR